MKDFMMIFIGPDYGDIGLSPEEIQGRMGKWFAWHEKMEKAGIVKEGNALTAEVKRIDSNRTVTDIASADVKELVGGYYVINVSDMNAALEVAQDFPDFELGGSVEVREVMVFDQE